MVDISRRRFLAAGAGAVGGAVAGSLLPPSVHRALALPPKPGGLAAVKHVVILMQENRAFDHYFGMLRGVRGYGDGAAIGLPSGRSVFEQKGPAGPVLPFSVRQAAQHDGRKPAEIQYIGGLDHGWDGGHTAWSKGWVDNWIAAKTPTTMAHYDRHDLPFQYELAETFTLCDAYHCSVFGPTNPNRMMMWTGKLGYEPNSSKRAVENDGYDEEFHLGYDWKTYPERLEAAGVSWQTYMEWDNFQDNAVEFFASFKAIAHKVLLPLGFLSLNTFYGALHSVPDAVRQVMLADIEAGVALLSARERSLFERGLRRLADGQLATKFRSDVDAGQLPRVSFIVPPAADSEHPGSSTPAASATITYKVLDALASNPDVWSSTLLLLNFDENDGYFDHVPPPVPPADLVDDNYDGRPIGLGFRVPMTVVSPWSAGGYVCSETFDHTSVLRLLEQWTGVQEPNISSWRRTVCGDLQSALDFSASKPAQSFKQPAANPAATPRWQPKPPAAQVLPAQEDGTRRARPLPYQPNARARLAAGGKSLSVALLNTGTKSAHFAMYPYAGEFAQPRHFDVAARHVEQVALARGKYHLAITGPNRFLRTFAGDTSGAGAHARVSPKIDARASHVSIALHNSGSTRLRFRLHPNAYRSKGAKPRVASVAAGRTTTIKWPTVSGWYDLTIRLHEDHSFVQRLTGCVENGGHRISGAPTMI